MSDVSAVNPAALSLRGLTKSFGDKRAVDTLDLDVRAGELYARLGMPDASRRIQPEPSLRVLFWERRYADIVARVSEQDPDEVDADALGELAFALQALGRDAAAIPLLQSIGLPELATDDDLRRWAALNHLATYIGALQADGQNERAQRLAQWLERFIDERFTVAVWETCALAALGKHEEAIREFTAVAHSANLLWLPQLMDLGCLRSLRDDPRYQDGVRFVQARHDALRERLPATLARLGLSDVE